MKQVLLVFIGGGFGSVARYLVGRFLNNPSNQIPYGTLLANVLGSLFIGIILGYLSKTSTISESQTLLFATGFCGGFTTFSTFAYENQLFIKNGDFTNLLIYTFSSLLIGVAAVFAGLYVSKLI